MTRIIGGIWKRTPLNIIKEDGLRPTPDRIKETVFNWLGDLTNTHGIDLFAGSGGLGLELLSRGGESSSLISFEINKNALRNLFSLQEKLKISPQRWKIIPENVLNYLAFKQASPIKHQILVIFCDPPFALMANKNSQEFGKLLTLYQQLLKDIEPVYFYWELPQKNSAELIYLIKSSHSLYQLHKQLNAGEVCATLWKRIDSSIVL